MLLALLKSLTLKETEAGSLPTGIPQLRLRMAKRRTLKHIRAATVTSMAIGIGTALCAKIGLEKKLMSSRS